MDHINSSQEEKHAALDGFDVYDASKMDYIRVDQEEYPAIFRLWALRVLVLLGRHRNFFNSYSPHFATVIGADESFDMENHNPEDKGKMRAEALDRLRQLHANAEKEMKFARVPENVYRNIAYLSTAIGLNDVECRVMEFAVLSQTFYVFLSTVDAEGRTGNIEMLISTVTGIPRQDVRKALSKNGKLNQSFVLRVTKNHSFDDAINVFPKSLVDAPDCASIEDFMSLFRSVIREEPESFLTLDDYPHIDAALKVLLPYLDKALKNRKKGVNIFIYGSPGTGKTEFTKVLAKALRCKALSISCEKNDEERSLGVNDRLRAFGLTQKLFCAGRNFLVFDEAGDIFGESISLFHRAEAQKNKGWFTNVLEENVVPTIWLANSIDNIDPALARRFDMIFEMPVPPLRQRETMIRKACEGFVSEKTIKKIAQVEVMAPAVIARASAVVKEAFPKRKKAEKERAFEQLVNCTLEAQGHKALKKDDPNVLPEYYGLEYLNTEANLLSISEGITAIKSGRLCLYGPPGTGKTAFARWLAQRLDVPLNVKRGSDLISMWVGGTERNIARAFREAERDGALLLIDEADSFLQDRRGAQRSWEITGVNEMLTQMENFSGVFVASTNLLDSLDQAALRRFDAKLKFGYLSAEQALRLLQNQCLALGVPAFADNLYPRLEKLAVLTPGDFATVARRHRFQPFRSAEEIIGKLEDECCLKGDFKSTIGFA